MKTPKRSYIFSENIYYSPIRRQWLVAYDSNGTVEGLLPRGWHPTRRRALLDLKCALEFRLGLTADCTELYKRLDYINKQLGRQTKLEASYKDYLENGD